MLKRSSISDANDDNEERCDSCEVTEPRWWRLTFDVRGALLSRVGDRTESPGVRGRRIAEAGNAGGPITVGTWLELLSSRVCEVTRPLAFAIAAL